MSRCCFGQTSHIWGCSEPFKGPNSQLANDEATKNLTPRNFTHLHFSNLMRTGAALLLHSHITLGRPNFSEGLTNLDNRPEDLWGLDRIYFFANLHTITQTWPLAKVIKHTNQLAFSVCQIGMQGWYSLSPESPPRIMVHHNHLLSHAYYVIPFQLLEYQWRESRFDTLGKLASAHPGGGQHPPGGWVPSCGWLRCAGGLLPSPKVSRDQIPLSHKSTASASEPPSLYDWGNLNV